MSWLFLGVICILFAVTAVVVWQKWVAPWRQIEQLVRQIVGNEHPRTFLVGGGPESKRVGLALENIFARQQELGRQIAGRESGTQTILRAMQDGLLVVDKSLRVTLVNQAFRKLFGLPEISLGAPLLDVVREATVDRLIAETLRTGKAMQSELVRADSKTNSERDVEISAVPVKDDAGLTTGAVVLFHDITQLKQTDKVRRDFVANVSHELRTPLSILRGYIETLLDNPQTSDKELSRILRVMERHSKRLGLLVDDLLTLARLESRSAGLQFSDVQLAELFQSVIRDWEKKLAEKQLKVVVDLSPDETRLHEVLYNLLDNALKYSLENGEIRLRAVHRGPEIVLSVTDNGIGISKGDLPRIFERFYRADKARSRELGGTGLGLAIVKHIAQLHGGRVEAESELGKGTTIRVILPARL
ncbi:MAG: PAS domain-containing protein [Verrucomicrobia bacterium]|nr:MAG: PAS domain-containing protein [Verrucomicrobiota bacterium]